MNQPSTDKEDTLTHRMLQYIRDCLHVRPEFADIPLLMLALNVNNEGYAIGMAACATMDDAAQEICMRYHSENLENGKFTTMPMNNAVQ